MDSNPHASLHGHIVGMRNIKTATAAALCAFVYYYFNRSPAFACIGAIFGMGADMEDSKRHGGNRLFGTAIGGLLGMLLFRIYLFFYPQGGHTLLLVPLVFIGTSLLIILCRRFWVGGVQPGGVILCILLFNTPVDTYISYALSRIFDTAVGVLIAMLINYLIPRERLPSWLGRWWDHIRGLWSEQENNADKNVAVQTLEEVAEPLEKTETQN